jgi:DNA-binding XRE family transcriptional regulator
MRKLSMGLTQEEIERIESKGFKVTTVKDFLDLTPEDELIIELRLALSTLLHERRKKLALSQTTVAKRMGSSQSRMARIENNDPSVSIDLLLKAVAATGATVDDVVDALRPRAIADGRGVERGPVGATV